MSLVVRGRFNPKVKDPKNSTVIQLMRSVPWPVRLFDGTWSWFGKYTVIWRWSAREHRYVVVDRVRGHVMPAHVKGAQ